LNYIGGVVKNEIKKYKRLLMIIVLLFQYGKTAYDMAVSIEKRVCTFVCHAIDMLQRLKIISFNNNIVDWTISCLID